ncbi:MAG: helix-turn-helix domain-containing protein [Candidatus Aminicenantes bacterium]|jgi:repressor LexA
MRKKILQQVAVKLRKIRQQAGLDRKEMAARLGITPGAYYKNEYGDALPSLRSMKYLADNYNISLDWLVFNKGPMLYEEKGKKERELEQEVKRLTAELDQECKKREEELKKYREKTAFLETKPEMQELLEYIEKVPIFYHKLMIFFQEYKTEHTEPGPAK